jgi:hypothetical protein
MWVTGLDNDIVPASAVGLRTALIRRGPWAWIQRDSPAARFTSPVPGSPAARSASPTLLLGHIRHYSVGTANLHKDWYFLRKLVPHHRTTGRSPEQGLHRLTRLAHRVPIDIAKALGSHVFVGTRFLGDGFVNDIRKLTHHRGQPAVPLSVLHMLCLIRRRGSQPEKRKVDSSILSLTTRSDQPIWPVTCRNAVFRDHVALAAHARLRPLRTALRHRMLHADCMPAITQNTVKSSLTCIDVRFAACASGVRP